MIDAWIGESARIELQVRGFGVTNHSSGLPTPDLLSLDVCGHYGSNGPDDGL